MKAPPPTLNEFALFMLPGYLCLFLAGSDKNGFNFSSSGMGLYLSKLLISVGSETNGIIGGSRYLNLSQSKPKNFLRKSM